MSEYKFKINGRDYNVSVNSISGSDASVTVNGCDYKVEIESDAKQQTRIAGAAIPSPASVTGGIGSTVGTTGAGAAGAAGAIVSPLPGVIIEVCVKEGDSVKRGQKIAVLEAMKMENEILSPSNGTVSSVSVKKGDAVLEGAPVATIA